MISIENLHKRQRNFLLTLECWQERLLMRRVIDACGSASMD